MDERDDEMNTREGRQRREHEQALHHHELLWNDMHMIGRHQGHHNPDYWAARSAVLEAWAAVKRAAGPRRRRGG